ncbi:MAG: ABC transporter ATP-binding protein/permease, partial [Vagococcus sp.]|nr:ABC transporter ATP-binding protein/permease [Vagococcus sp.]
IFTFFFILFFMFKQDSKLTLLIMITFPMLYLLNVFFSKRIKLAYKKVRNSTSLVNNHLQTSLTSILLIKTFTSENSEEEKFKELNNQNKNDYLEAMKYQTVFSPAIDLVNYLGLGIVLLYSGSQIIKGEQTIGSLVAYMAYLKMLQNPIRSFTQMVSRFQQAVVSYSRIIEIFDSEPKITTVKDSMQLEKFSSRIAFENVTFSYKNNIKVLNKVNFDMKYGEVTAIVGISGSGKSTITKLIERLYDVTDGKILIDSHDIKKYSLESLRNNIGLVSQDIELIDGTIYENIIYGQPNKSDKEVIKAIEAANLVEFINNLPKGVETEVGEKGIKLSGGKKQRIAIARIFLKNAPVLILDEATASLDNESERYIQESLDQLLEKRTSIVIAHRLSTIQKADQILVLDQGMIVEKGTHEELLNKNKRYRKLYDAQFS